MLPKRTQIRYYVKQLLSAPAIKSVRAVQFNRSSRVANEESPLIIVYTRSESAEIYVAAPRELERILKLVVEILVYDKTAEPNDDLLDRVAQEVERRLSADEQLGGLVSDLVLSDTEFDFISDSEAELAVCRVTFDVKYYTEASIDPATLDDFETYEAEYKQPVSTPETPPVVDKTDLV